MIIAGDSTIREVGGISEIEKEAILNFLQGAVYCWCKNRKEEWFSMRELMGGDNRDWKGTPLFVLYNKHICDGKTDEESFELAGRDSGWLLKKTIQEDSRKFESKEEDIIRKYRWNDI
jgi:hypothetical protein